MAQHKIYCCSFSYCYYWDVIERIRGIIFATVRYINGHLHLHYILEHIGQWHLLALSTLMASKTSFLGSSTLAGEEGSVLLLSFESTSLCKVKRSHSSSFTRSCRRVTKLTSTASSSCLSPVGYTPSARSLSTLTQYTCSTWKQH